MKYGLNVFTFRCFRFFVFLIDTNYFSSANPASQHQKAHFSGPSLFSALLYDPTRGLSNQPCQMTGFRTSLEIWRMSLQWQPIFLPSHSRGSSTRLCHCTLTFKSLHLGLLSVISSRFILRRRLYSRRVLFWLQNSICLFCEPRLWCSWVG